MTRETGIHLPELSIRNFRGLGEIDTDGIPPVCLVTGPPGSGKSSLLDAVEVYAGRGNPETLRRILRNSSDVMISEESGKTIPDRDALFHLAVWGDWSLGRHFLELMLRLIDEGLLDEARGPVAVNSDFWSLVYRFRSKNQSWGCEVVGHYFNRRRQLSLDAGQVNPFDHSTGTSLDSQTAEDVLIELAANAPTAFVREVFPFMQAVIENCASRERSGLVLDPIWSHRAFGSGYGIEDALLKSMEIALSKLAVQYPEKCRSVIDPLRESPFETIQYLLARTFASDGALFANEAVDHLCENPERLYIGYMSDSHWASRQLIESISPHCSDEKLQQLEVLLLGYYPDWERSAPGRRQYGYAQFTLLNGITARRRSQEVSKRLEELRRKFGRPEPETPRPMKVELVPSPIPEHAAEKMGDEEWLSAIRQHNSDEHGITHDGHLGGGARELSRVLENRVKLEPARFAELVSEFPDEANQSYFEAVLRGISEADLDIETVTTVCERCHRIEGRPLGREICQPIASATQGEVPSEALDIVAWYATEDPDPDRELWRTTGPHSSDYYYRGNALEHGINTTRGRAAQAVARLIEGCPERITYLHSALEKMVQDPSIAVRSCVAQALIAVLRYDKDLAVELFLQLCNTEDALLQTHYVERFIYFGVQTHFEELSEILVRMVNSQEPEVASVGGRQACLAALDLEEAAAIANLCLSGSEAQKVGAAQVMAANVRVATCRAFCEDALIKLFNDPYETVRAEAARCFLRFKGPQLEEYGRLINEFVSSKAFSRNYYPVLRALEQTTAKLPEATLSACERFVDIAGLAAADISTREAGDADTVIKLALRTYQQSSDDTIRARSLDLIDKLMEHGTHGINDALEEFER